jgi:hypothetical protein
MSLRRNLHSLGAPVSNSVCRVAVGSLLTVGLVGLAVSPLSASQSSTAPKSGGFQLAVDSGVGATFTLDSLSSCQIGDGLAVVSDVGKHSIRVTAVSTVIPSDKTTTRDRTTYQLLSLRPRSTTGEVGALFNLTAMGKTLNLGSVVGGVLKPVTTSHRWYAIVARIRILQNHPVEWVIRGIRVTLQVDSRTYHVLIPQTIRLSATTNC